MSIQALRERRNALAKEAKNLLANNGDKVWTAEDKAAWDVKADEIERLDSQIAAMQRNLDEAAEQNFRDVEHIDVKDKAKVAARNAFAKMIRSGAGALSAEEHAMIRNTMSTTTGNQGGYAVQTSVASELVDLLKGYRGVRDVASYLRTENGAALSYPSSDGTSEEGEIIAENGSATGADPVFGTVPVNTFKFGSKKIGVPIELLQDATIDIVSFINNRIRDRIGRIQNKKFSIGTGTGEPYGITVAASVGKTGTTGQTLTVIYDDLVDLTESVDYAYDNGGLKFMLSQNVRKVVRKIKDTAGRPIWTPSYDAGVSARTPDQLLGYDVVLNNDMPTPAASAKSIAFGDFSKYLVRDAMEVTLFRFEDSVFVSAGQIGFLAWARAGGNLLDTGAVKLYQHSAT